MTTQPKRQHVCMDTSVACSRRHSRDDAVLQAAIFRLLPHLVVGQKHTIEHVVQNALPASLLQRLVRLAIQDAHLQGQMTRLSISCEQVQPKRLECSKTRSMLGVHLNTSNAIASESTKQRKSSDSRSSYLK